MWCRQCQQDVPVLATSEEGKSCCPRCGLALGIAPIERKSAEAAPFGESIHAASAHVGAILDDWDSEERLRHIERELHIKKSFRRPPDGSAGKRTRADSAHNETAERHRSQAVRAKSNARRNGGADKNADGARAKKTPPPRDSALLGFLTWTAILLGVAALVGGGISLGCAVLGNRPDYWNYGLPFVVGGQIVLLVGLVLQLDRLWRENRSAAAKLDEVDEELHDLKTTAALLGTAHGPAAGAFYAHYAGGANAQLLLTDLKSQLDLLAIKIAGYED
ncbi:MAG: hypothetical protein IT426_15980 [Pirellulales bacterium]|nr:hypothetical protein [Pirellulales bacterium]